MFTPSRLLMIRFPQILVEVGVKGLARVTMLITFCLSLALTVSHVVEHFVRLEVDGGVVGMVGYDYFKTLTPRPANRWISSGTICSQVSTLHN